MSEPVEFHTYGEWKEFSVLEISKRTRFQPGLQYFVSGLDPNKQYKVRLILERVNDCRYKMANGGWYITAHRSTLRPLPQTIEHHHGIQSGDFWMKNSICYSGVTCDTQFKGNPYTFWVEYNHLYQLKLVVESNEKLYLVVNQYQTFIPVYKKQKFYKWGGNYPAFIHCPHQSFNTVTGVEEEGEKPMQPGASTPVEKQRNVIIKMAGVSDAIWMPAVMHFD